MAPGENTSGMLTFSEVVDVTYGIRHEMELAPR